MPTEEQNLWLETILGKTGLIAARKVSSKRTSSPPIKAPPKQPAKDATTAVQALADRIPIRVDVFLNTWLIAVTQAIDEVPPPKLDDLSAEGNFYRALSGNMLWAATSLFSEWQPIVVGMSFVGAAMGSGVGADAAADQPPTPTADIHALVDKVRDTLSKFFRAKAKAFAEEIIKGGAVGVDAEDTALWNRIFKNGEFNNIGALKTLAVAAVKSAVQQYTEQWTSWTATTEREAAQRLAKLMSQMAGGRMPAGLPDTLLKIQLKDVRKQNPFTPKLVFSAGA